jgi:chromosome segregation ATPase
MLVAEIDKLGELQGKIEVLRARRLTLETQKANVADLLAAASSGRGPLAKALAQGDTSAGEKLDELDDRELYLQRKLDGIALQLSENAAEIAPLEVEFGKESALEAARERQKQFEAATQRAEMRAKKVRALEAELTAEFTALHAELSDLNAIYHDLLGGNVATRIYDTLNFRLERINADWRHSPKTFGPSALLTIQPVLPPRR